MLRRQPVSTCVLGGARYFTTLREGTTPEQQQQKRKEPQVLQQQINSSHNAVPSPLPYMQDLFRNCIMLATPFGNRFSPAGTPSTSKSFPLWRKDDNSNRLLKQITRGAMSRCNSRGGNGNSSEKKNGDEASEPKDGLFRGIFNNSSNDKNNNKKDGGGSGGDEGDEEESANNQRGGDQVLKHYFFGTLSILALTGIFYYMASPSGPNVTWEEARGWSDKITAVKLYENFVQFYLDTGDVCHIGLTHSTARTDLYMKSLNLGPEVPVTYVGWTYSEGILQGLGTILWLLPILFFPVYSLGMARLVSSAPQQNAGSKMTNKKMFSVVKRTNTHFKDIAGMHEAKREVKEVVDFLKNPEPYAKLGAKIPSGALLLGPPGTGKTLLAKAVAGEAGVSFIPTNGSDFVELYVGMGALRVRQLFELAKKQEGRTIIYIDEIDAIGLKRRGAGHGEKQEQEHTLNELLTQLDGFNTEESKVLLLASSNVGQDMLDPALIRPGRFDRIIHVDAPVLAERKEIFNVHLNKLKLLEPPVVSDLPDSVLDLMDGKGIDGEEIPKEIQDQINEDIEKLKKENPNLVIESAKAVKVEIPNDPASMAAAKKKAEEANEAAFAAKLAAEKEKEAAKPAEEAGASKTMENLAKGMAAGFHPMAGSLGGNNNKDQAATSSDSATKATSTESDSKDAETKNTQEMTKDEAAATPKTDPTTDAATTADADAKVEADKKATWEDSTKLESEAPATEAEEPQKKEQEKEEPKTPQEIYEAKKENLVAEYGARMSDLCPGFVGADISNVCNEAAILAARQNDSLVTIDHLEKSIDRVLAGIEMRSRVLSDFEKNVVAHHEAGHAIAGWYLNRADPLMKVSIVPRGGKALGYAQYLPSENNLKSGKDILDSMCVALGGRVAEDIYFSHLSTGASDDLMKVTRMAYQHVSSFSKTGMAHTPPNRLPNRKAYGDNISNKLDASARELVDEAYRRTHELLTLRKPEMTKLADHLMKHEILTHQDVIDYLGARESRKPDFRIA